VQRDDASEFVRRAEDVAADAAEPAVGPSVNDDGDDEGGDHDGDADHYRPAREDGWECDEREQRPVAARGTVDETRSEPLVARLAGDDLDRYGEFRADLRGQDDADGGQRRQFGEREAGERQSEKAGSQREHRADADGRVFHDVPSLGGVAVDDRRVTQVGEAVRVVDAGDQDDPREKQEGRRGVRESENEWEREHRPDDVAGKWKGDGPVLERFERCLVAADREPCGNPGAPRTAVRTTLSPPSARAFRRRAGRSARRRRRRS